MLAFGPLSFAAPLALLGLLALPALWLLLRATPPAPKRAIFPPLRLLLGAPDDTETPHHAPWWLIVFRLLLAALLVIALARPSWTPPSVAVEDEPLLIVMDNGWSSAPAWSAMEDEALRLLARAEREGRLAALVSTAPSDITQPALRLDQPDAVRRRLDSLQVEAWGTDRAATAQRIRDAVADGNLPGPLAVTWLSDGLDDEGAQDLASALQNLGNTRLVEPDAGRAPLALLPPEPTSDGLRLEVRRASSALPLTTAVTAFGNDGRALARSEGVFGANETSLSLDMALPLDLRNRIASLRLSSGNSAGAVQLMGDQWRRPRIGLLATAGEQSQPLLSDLHYVENALANISETERGTLESVLENDPAVLVMVDDARSDDQRIENFVTEGGLLIRFAGPRLAARGDDLLPVDLREGGRLFGGALNWDEPQRIAAFAPDSPFAGLPVDVTATIDRQVLAQPGSATPDRVWARLEDGTPLVTAQRRGRGWIVLFHVTAGPDWSDLPLSGLFPRMLQRTLGLAQGNAPATTSGGAWVIDQALDSAGQLTRPPATTRPVADEMWAATRASQATPPGLYRLGSASAALNIATADTRMQALPRDLPGVIFAGLDGPRALEFLTPLLVTALIMMMLDVLISLGLAGRLPQIRRGLAGGAACLLAFVIIQPGADAQDPLSPADQFALDAALQLRFAYVETGDGAVDRRSREGLTGLSQDLTRRTAIEPTTPMAVNVEQDELIFFPMIYWPVRNDAAPLSDQAAERVSAYLQSGGLIIFDTQDADIAVTRAGAPHPGLVTVLESIDVPPLAPIPVDHVLTKSFYLLQEFPGRFSGSPVWVEANPSGASRDGTSGVLIGAHDWASAWAVGADGSSSAPVEGGEHQREMARRFGINLAMYALTGNYKADQVHIPDILERLGQ